MPLFLGLVILCAASILILYSAGGANAHLCDLSVAEARFDPATGWWSARNAEGDLVPLFRVDGRRIMLRYSGNLGNTPEDALDFMSCGARAGFDEGIDLSPAQ